MPPKRKAASANTDPPRTRTRSAATSTAEETLVELPPAKRTRRRANEEPALEKENAEDYAASGSKKPTRATAKGRKAEPEAEDASNQPQTRVSRMQGRAKKQVETPMDIEEHASEEPKQPPSRIPRMRGKGKSLEEEPQALEPSRPSRTRIAQVRGKPNKETEEEPQPETNSRSPSPAQETAAKIVPKKRGRATKAKPEPEPEADSEATPEPEPSKVAESSRPKRTRVTRAVGNAQEEELSQGQESASPKESRTKSSRARRKVGKEKAEESDSDSPPLAAKNNPKKRGRATKAKDVVEPEPDLESEHEREAESEAALEADPEEVVESSRPKRARLTKPAAKSIPKRRGRAAKDVTEEESEHEPSEAADTPPPAAKTRGKRKAAVPAQPATKRTRSSKVIDPPSPPPAEVQDPAPKGRTTRGKVKSGPVGPPEGKQRKPTSLAPEESGSSSEDELDLLSSPKRPATPTRRVGSRVGTPRTILHAVEITTPRHLLKTLKRDLGSPAPRDSAHSKLGTPRLPAAFPTVSGSTTARTPSPSPVPVLDTTPRATRRGAPASPAKGKRAQSKQRSDQLPSVLPEHLHPLLNRQKRAILRSLQRPPEIDEVEVYGEDYPSTNTAAYEQLSELLTGSVARGEGNSCLLIGPSGSGKTQMVERVIATLPSSPIVVRLSGYAQHNDKLAIREIAWQLAQQTGQSFLPSDPDEADEEDANGDGIEPKEVAASKEQGIEAEADDDENPFVESAPAEPIVALPPPAHLLALISMIPTLPRPTVIVIDGFDLFAGHARQALLYCLLDTAQSCRAGTNSGTGSGMAVVGVTARVDTINLLEKRVKSRFSGRMIRTACPTKLEHWVELAKTSLGAPIAEEPARADEDGEEGAGEWANVWAKAVERFVGDEEVVETLRETYALTRDFQMFRRIMTSMTLDLSAISPYPTQAKLESAVKRQRCPPRYPPLHTLPYPAVCLLIASMHAQTSGHDVFTFEMLHEAFKSQVRASQSAPVEVEGGSIGMVRCSREVLFSAFERLVDLHVFRPAAAPAASIAKEFALHRSTVDRFAVRKAVETLGQFNLKKWLTKAA